MDMNLQPLVFAGTQRPDCPFTLQTSCFRLVLATQQAPAGTGRFAFTPWGVGDARAELARARIRAEMVNFILGGGEVFLEDGKVWVSGVCDEQGGVLNMHKKGPDQR